MKRAIAIIAAAAVLAPAAAAARTQDPTVHRRVIVAVDRQTQTERRVQQRIRDQARARAEQVRREYREEATDKSSRTLKTGANGEIELANLSGDIIINRGGGNTAQLEILKVARARTLQEAKDALGRVNVHVEERGSRAQVSAHYPRTEDRGPRQNVSVSVQYTLTAPENTRISANTLSGNVSVSGITGDLNLVTISGDVTATDAARVMSAKSTSGKVELVNLRSEVRLEAETVSGDIILRQSQLPRVELGTVTGSIVITDVRADRIEAETLNGDIQFNTPLVRNGRYELSSHSGTITLIPTGDVGFGLEVDSFSGSIQTLISLKNQETEDGNVGRRGSGRVRSISGTYGDGGATMEVTTFSGRVVLGKK
jgi:DUF4097 and DUF4098 domain-containing protein YvlB